MYDLASFKKKERIGFPVIARPILIKVTRRKVIPTSIISYFCSFEKQQFV